jgi:hypothetical protein
MTVRDLIRGAMRLLRAVGAGDSIIAEEAIDGLAALNDMVDAWNAENLMVFASARDLYALQSGKASYTLGASGGADWIAPRPVHIDHATYLDVSNPSQPFERAMRLLTEPEWAAIALKSVTNTLPDRLYYDPTFPLGTVKIWPVPAIASQIALYTPAPVTSFSSLDDQISLPPGYSRALRYNLAVEMQPEYGKGIDPNLIRIAMEAKGVVRSRNLPDSLTHPDHTGVTTSRSTWDITMGGYR